jgi:hypothetical protein
VAVTVIVRPLPSAAMMPTVVGRRQRREHAVGGGSDDVFDGEPGIVQGRDVLVVDPPRVLGFEVDDPRPNAVGVARERTDDGGIGDRHIGGEVVG